MSMDSLNKVAALQKRANQLAVTNCKVVAGEHPPAMHSLQLHIDNVVFWCDLLKWEQRKVRKSCF